MRLVFSTLPPFVVATGALDVAPADERAWLCEALGCEPITIEPASTELGWPVQLVHGVCRDAAGEVVEHRLAAVFRCFHFVAASSARFATVAELAAHADALFAWWATARPDFHGDRVLALAELWQSTQRR